MVGRIAVGFGLVLWILFGAATTAWGQVELFAQIEDVAYDDRYGDYEPVDFAEEGPVLLPPARTVSSRQNLVAQVAPLVNPTRGEEVPSAPVVVPPATSAPVMIQYAPPPAYAAPPMYGPAPVYGSPSGHQCPPWRPCGPQESFGMNWLLPQGFAGADFRPACAGHDACLASKCHPRKVCDKAFLYSMDSACNNSKFPLLCRLEARKCYLGVRLFGWMF